MHLFQSVIFSSPVYCMKVITDNLITTGDDDGCVKVKNNSYVIYKIPENKHIIITTIGLIFSNLTFFI